MASRTEARTAVLVLGLVAAAVTGARLWLGANLELSPDEAYYWLWSKELRWSYPDHPPLVAYLIRAGTSLIGESELGVRLFFAVSTLPTMAGCYLLCRTTGLRPAFAAAGSVLTTLLVTASAASLIATPDTPLGLAWLVGTAALCAAVVPPRHGSPLSPWLCLAGALGVGLWSKHSAWLLLPLALVALWNAPRGSLARASAALGLGALLALPVLIADLGGSHSAAALQASHLLGQLSPAPEGPRALLFLGRLGELVGGQLGFLTPPLVVLAGLGLRRTSTDPTSRVLAASYAIPLFATAAASLFTHPEQNWASLGHPALVVAACRGASDSWSSRPIRRLWWSSIALLLLVAAVVHGHALRPFLPLPPRQDPVSRLHGWSGLGELVASYPQAKGALCDNYGLCAELAWQSRRHTPAWPVSWQDRPSPAVPGRPRLLLDEEGDPGHSSLRPTPVEPPAQTLELRRKDNETVRVLRVWVSP